MTKASTRRSKPVPDMMEQASVREDAARFGELILMASAMYGQGLDPPLPPDFPPDYDVIGNVIMCDFWQPAFYGFLARARQSSTHDYVLVVRGTEGRLEPWLDGLSIYPAPFYDHGKVGFGFSLIYKTMMLNPRGATELSSAAGVGPAARPFADQVSDAIKTHAATAGLAAPSSTSPRLAVAGHSLGAALVTLFSVERLALQRDRIVGFYTFGSPMVGDGNFKAAFDAALSGPITHRIFIDTDRVPTLPPSWFMKFVPVGAAYEIVLDPHWNRDMACSHSLDTYIHHLDPSHPPAAACTRPAATLARAALAAQPAALAPAATTIRQGSTTVTITIETSSGR